MMSRRSTSGFSVRAWSLAVGASQSKIVDLLVENLVNVVSVVGLVLVFWPARATHVAGVVVFAAGVGLVGWLLRREAGRRSDLLWAYAGPRIVLLLGVAGLYLWRRPAAAGWVEVATGLVLLTLLSEPTLRVLLDKSVQVAVHLPGVQAVPDPPFPPQLLPVLTLVHMVLGALLALLAAPGWAYLLLCGLVTAASVVTAGHAGRANVASKRAAAGVHAALEDYRPEFCVYYAGEHGTRYQLGMWLPYLERVGRPFVVITRLVETVPVIASLTSAPVVVPRTNSAYGDLNDLVVGSLRAAFYVQGNRANYTFQRNRQLTHVWLNHGDSDKAANFSAQHASYDKIFVPGQQGVERYAAHGVQVPPERFALVGRPQAELIQLRDAPLPAGAPRTVLYAPTWRGGRPATNYSSLPLGERIVGALLQRGCTVIFRPHPLSYTDPGDTATIRRIQARLDRDRRSGGPQHVFGEPAERTWDIPGCFNASDALITDVSSVATDYLAAGKPLAVVAVRGKGKKFRQDFPIARVSYVIEGDLSTLETVLDQLSGDDPLAEGRRTYRRHCLGDSLGPAAAEPFLAAVRGLLEGKESDPKGSFRSAGR